jgi:hypothetical protein
MDLSRLPPQIVIDHHYLWLPKYYETWECAPWAGKTASEDPAITFKMMLRGLPATHKRLTIAAAVWENASLPWCLASRSAGPHKPPSIAALQSTVPG